MANTGWLRRFSLGIAGRMGLWPMRFTILVLSICSSSAAAQYGGGTGDPNTPYLISTPTHLQSLTTTTGDWNKHFRLTANLDLTGVTMTPIGTFADPFSGTFDGNGHTISNLTFNLPTTDYVGLFGYVDNTVDSNIIFDLGLIDLNITGQYYVGGLVGKKVDTGMINNCYVEGANISGNERVGGLAGDNAGEIIACYANGTISGIAGIGGLVGYNDDGAISTSYATGDVSGTAAIGGLAGLNEATISTSYAIGNVSGTAAIGGLVGYNIFSGMINTSYATGDISGTEVIGGLAGNNSGTINNCYATGLVNNGVSGTDIGGLIGENYLPIHIHNSYWAIDSSGQATSAGGTGKLLSEMKQIATFIGWACEVDGIWTIDEGSDTPRLAWENQVGTIITADIFFSGGTGTSEDPYQITHADELVLIDQSTCLLEKHFALTDDIDLSGYDGQNGNPAFDGIGTATGTHLGADDVYLPFAGVFDGRGHRILNLTMNTTGYNDGIGLFCAIHGEQAEVKNLILENVIIENMTSRFGEDSDIGALAGLLFHGTVSNCHIRNGLVTGKWQDPDGWHDTVGGLIGKSYGKTLRCSFEGTVSGDRAGGLIGILTSGIPCCDLGDQPSTGVIEHSSSKGQCNGISVGGLFASASGQGEPTQVVNCFSQCQVNGEYTAGGLGGEVSGIIINCYASGEVAGTNYVGGLLGSYSGDIYTKSFWNASVNPGLTGIGNGSDPNVIGETTANLQIQSTFTNKDWDFVGEDVNGTEGVWRMCVDGVDYPRLRWEFDRLGDWVCPDGVFVEDLAVVVDEWLTIGTDYPDLAPDGGDGIFDLYDVSALATNWMAAN